MVGAVSLTITYQTPGSDGTKRTVTFHNDDRGVWQPSCTCTHGKHHFPANCKHVKSVKANFLADKEEFFRARSKDDAYWKGYEDGFTAAE